jgi:hypothetical protein
VARRGEVLVALRRLGFGAAGRREHFVVVQSDLLSGIETAVVAPLDDVAPIYDQDPLVVRVTAKEAGTKFEQVVLGHLLTAIPLEKLDAAPTGRLSAKSLARVDEVLRIVLSL